MTIKECCSCRKELLSKNDIGICKKMLGEKTKQYYCIDCLASYLDVSTQDLLDKIEEFKEEGCKLFS